MLSGHQSHKFSPTVVPYNFSYVTPSLHIFTIYLPAHLLCKARVERTLFSDNDIVVTNQNITEHTAA